MRATIERWKECCRRAGIPSLYLAVVQQSFDGLVDPRNYGLDAAVEFPPHNLGCAVVERNIEFYDAGFSGRIYDYLDASDRALAKSNPEYTLFRGIITSWDCTPRRKDPDIFINSTPQRYERWLMELLEKTDRHCTGEEKLVFVNAWNEWAEGAYLEPDRHFGYGYLNATASAINGYKRSKTETARPRMLLAAHIFYGDLVREFADCFMKVPAPFDILVTTTREQRLYILDNLKELLRGFAMDITVVAVEEGGRDFGPFVLELLPRVEKYDLVCWTHSKKSPYNPAYATWRQYLLDNLLGSPERVQAILDTFSRRPRLGLVYPRAYSPVADRVEWGSNFGLASMLLGRLNLSAAEHETPRFPTGSMFWFRPRALMRLLDLKLSRQDFIEHGDGPRDPQTGLIVDGTIGHALERMLVYVAEAAGFDTQEMSFSS